MNEVKLYFKKIIPFLEGYYGDLNPVFKARIDSAKDLRRKSEVYTAYVVLKQLGLLKDFRYNGHIPTLTKGFISYTHDGEYLVMALCSNESIGIDLSKIVKVDRKLLKQTGCKDLDTFHKKWTIYESFSKLSGLGTDVLLNNLEIDLEKKEVYYLSHKVDIYLHQEKFEDYYLAIMSMKEFEIKERNFL